MRHSPKSPMNPRDRPQRWQRLYLRELNFGFSCCFTIQDFFANASHPFGRAGRYRLKGKPMSLRSSNASSSASAVVTMVTSMPLTISTLS